MKPCGVAYNRSLAKCDAEPIFPRIRRPALQNVMCRAFVLIGSYEHGSAPKSLCKRRFGRFNGRCGALLEDGLPVDSPEGFRFGWNADNGTRSRDGGRLERINAPRVRNP